MTSAEFDTRRRGIGLSIAETAAVCAVAERTVNRWINHTAGDVPDDVAAALDAIETRMDGRVRSAVRQAADDTMAGPVVLRRHRSQAELDAGPERGLPLGAHAIFVAWTADALAAEGVGAVIVWADMIDA